MSVEPPTPHRGGSPEHGGPVTDFALIESQKENIRPLASGRSAATLGVLFDKDQADEVSRVVEEGSKKFLSDIQEAERRDREGEDMVDGVQDVLDLYNRYVAFMVQHYPSSPNHVLPLLEETTRRFIGDARYAQDARYLKLWIMFARHVERREEVWAFLESRDIGTRHAAFYEEWAMAAEGLGRKKKADDVYRLGLARKAAPVERLKNRHQAFLTRIMAPPSGAIPDDDPAPAAPTPARAVLGQVGRGGLGGGSVSGATPGSSSSRISKGTNGSKIAIFSDESGAAEAPEPTPWDDFGTRDGRRKENVVEATPWKGETLPQKGRVAPRTPKLEVFKDNVTANAEIHRGHEVLGGIRAKAPLSDAELLRADPLRNYDTTGVPSAVPSVPSLPLPPKPAAKKTKRDAAAFVMQPWTCPTGGAESKMSNGKTERRMFDWDATFRGDEEWSFEEVRARKLGLLGRDWKELKDWEKGWHKPGSSTPKVQKTARPPSPTVNTKLANAEVMSLFNQTIHGNKVHSDDSDDDDDDDEDEEADEVNALPTPLPPARQQVSMMTPGGAVPPTPTPAPGYNHNNYSHPSHYQLATPGMVSDENAPAPASLRKLNIFSDENASAPPVNDENAVPSSARKLNVFSDTPARAPLGAKAPLSSASKPRAFAVFSDTPVEEAAPAPAPINDENDYVQATPARPPAGNIFATPAVFGNPSQTAAVPEGIAEEEEDERYEYYESDDQLNDEDPSSYGRRMRRFQIHEMTPITERTGEWTTNTTWRSSRRASVLSEFDEADEAAVVSQPLNLSSVAEEEERSGAASNRQSPEPTFADDTEPPQSASTAATEAYDRSGSVDTGAFGVPEGYTIARDMDTATSMMNTMVVVDNTSITDDFVTAPQGGEAASQPAAELANPCNPADASVVHALLQRVQPPVSSMALIVDQRHSASARLPALQRAGKAKARRSSTTSRISVAPSDDSYNLSLGPKTFEVREKLGEGGFGAVFLAVDAQERDAAIARADESSDNEDEDEDDTAALVAIKVEHPSSLWEGVILSHILARLDPSLSASIIRPRGLHVYSDESFLVLDFSPQGTLLDVVNKAVVWGISPGVAGGPSVPDELVAIFFTIELLRLVEGLHAADIIHGDLKIDNCLVRLEEIPSAQGGKNAWSAQYDRRGGSGWSYKGVRLIDFGRAADLSLFPAGRQQTFIADWQTDERDCVEMREGRPWSFEADYFGLASICYCLLFGKYIATEAVETEAGRRYKIDTPLKRYWQTELWSKLFDTLLNPRTLGGELPITNELGAIRQEFETWLEDNCQKNGKLLKQMLKRIELRALENRRV
ncbi:protein kinase [Vanrija albida]|uniref:Protein kinase n=1 Tax=Vanrija albida TaxID=181172 RepID=A0ABR3PYG5_9TREE